jgi:hypothetical protein
MRVRLFFGPLNGKTAEVNASLPEVKIRLKRRVARHIWIPDDLDNLVCTYRRCTNDHWVFVGWDHDPSPNRKVL